MILQQFYLDKKERIESEMSFNGFIPDITLYNDQVFRSPIATPTILFKYDNVDWESKYNANVTFCLYIMMPLNGKSTDAQNYESVFDLSHNIDKAVLEEKETMRSAGMMLQECLTSKIREKQYCDYHQYELANADCFIWEISYRTSLIISELSTSNKIDNYRYTIKELENQGCTLTRDSIGEFVSIDEIEVYEFIELSSLNNN